MENIKKWAIVLLIVNLVVVIYYGQSIKKEIRAVKVEHASYFQNLSNQISNQGNNLSSSMEYLIRESNNLITEYKHKIVNTDLAQKRGDIEFEVVIKESSSNSKIIGEFKELDSTNSYEVEFEQIEGLTYRGNIKLALDKNYEVLIYEQMNDGATRKLNNSEISLHLYNEVYANRIQSLGSGTSTTADELTYTYSFRFTTDIIEGADIAKVLLEATDDKQNIIAEYDITSSISAGSFHSAQLADKYRLAVASGEIDAGMAFDDYAAEFGDEFVDTEQSYLEYSVEKRFTKDELDENWEMFSDGRYYFTVKVIFEDGIEIRL